MDSEVARNLFSRLIQTAKSSSSGPFSISPGDAKSLRDVATEIVRRDKAGIRARWGPQVPDMNDLCDIILTKEQIKEKGQRKAEIAQAMVTPSQFGLV